MTYVFLLWQLMSFICFLCPFMSNNRCFIHTRALSLSLPLIRIVPRHCHVFISGGNGIWQLYFLWTISVPFSVYSTQHTIQYSTFTFYVSQFAFHISTRFHSFYRLFFSYPVAAFLQSRFNCLVYSQSWIVWSFVVFVVVVVVE